jgi:tRNA pseudouridine38-40 synthase
MNNIKMTIAYDGGPFHGWQKTKEGPSIEEALQTTLEQILQEPIVLQAASRTDAGVHAEEQIVNFLTSKKDLNLKSLSISLNSLLPAAIAVLKVEQVPQEFHPTLNCKGKEYHYWICYSSAQMPKNRFYSWHYHHPLDISNMRLAASFFIGKHNFQAFCNGLKNTTYENYEREISALEILEWPCQRLQIIVKGNNFLFRMVRNIVGTLVYVGRKKIAPEGLPTLIKILDRTLVGPTAPPHGLTLFKIFY